jgi:glutathione S-transferase
MVDRFGSTADAGLRTHNDQPTPESWLAWPSAGTLAVAARRAQVRYLMAAPPGARRMQLHGRSSSHFTRIARIFAAEAEVAIEFVPIRDLMSENPDDYGGHPALKMPTLLTEDGIWYGSLPICRELVACSELSLDIVWPEDLTRPVAANAQELVSTAMATEVGLVMGQATGVAVDNKHQAKMRASLLGAMEWLELNGERALATLAPERDLSFLEVSLFCLLEHLPFRQVPTLDAYPQLRAFAQRFAARSSAKATEFKFDVPAG